MKTMKIGIIYGIYHGKKHNLEKLDPIHKNEFRYCFNFPKNETLPEYGDPTYGGNGTWHNSIQI